jgi:hypothetical protein
MSSIIRRAEFLLGIILVVSAIHYTSYFFEVPKLVKEVDSWLITNAVIIASIAVWVGIYTMTRRELLRVVKRRRGRLYSLWMVGLAWFMILVGLFLGREAVPFKFCTDAFVIPGDATIYAILVFYLTSSAARAFKIRDMESFLLMITAVLVFLKQAPVGEFFFPWVSPIGKWLTDNLAMAATRVFAISAALGGVVLGIRLMYGKEMAMIGLIRRREEE